MMPHPFANIKSPQILEDANGAVGSWLDEAAQCYDLEPSQ